LRLTLSVASIAAAQVTTGYPVCVVPLVVGEVPDKPFTAPLIRLPPKGQPGGNGMAAT